MSAIDGPKGEIHGLTVQTRFAAAVRYAPDRSKPGDDALLNVAPGHDVGGGIILETSCFALDPSAEHPVVASRQSVAALRQKGQLLPAEPIKIANGVVRGHHNCAIKKWHCFCGEPCRCQ